MQPLLYFLLWAGLIFIMMRFGCGAHVMGHGSHGGHKTDEGSPKEQRQITPLKATDPVCGMTVEPAKAKSSLFEGVAYYFCSNQCREKFEAAPGTYISRSKSLEPEKEHHHA